MKTDPTLEKSRRIGLIDAIRGAALIYMIFYHIMCDFDMLGFEWAAKVLQSQEIVVKFDTATFIALSGICCSLSKNNALRGAQLLCVSVLMTAATMLVSPRSAITFGILHLLSIAMLVWAAGEKLFKKLPALVMTVVCAALYAFTYNVKRGYFGFGDLTVIVPEFLEYRSRLYAYGFIDSSYSALDYAPLLPHLFLFLAAAFLGVWLFKHKLPEPLYRKVPFLGFLGQHSLMVYLIHQPVCYGIIYLAAMLTGRI